MTRESVLKRIRECVAAMRSNYLNRAYANEINNLILIFNLTPEELRTCIEGLPAPRRRPSSGKWTADDVGEFWPKTFDTDEQRIWVVDALNKFSKGTSVDAVALANAINKGRFDPPPS